MLARLADLVVRRRVVILALTLVGVVVAGAFGGGVASRLSSGGFDDAGSESFRAERALEAFGGESNFLLLVTAKTGDVDSPAVTAAGAALTERLSKEADVSFAASYWTLGKPAPLKSKSGDSALVLARIRGTQDEINKAAEDLIPAYEKASNDAVDVRPGGLSAVYHDVNVIIEEDTKKADAIAIPVTLVLLILVFGSVVAALLPLAVGLLAIIGTFLVLTVVASMTEVSIYALSLTTAMGLGLAIDYSLFIVSRYREELRNGLAPDDAVRRSVVTAGRTVTFSALTVAASLGALLVFPLAFLRSFAYAGIAVVAMATVGAVVVLPALLAVLGTRVDKWVLWRHKPAVVGEGMWHRIAVFVMRRPWPIALGVVALLLVLGAPFLSMKLGLPDDRVLPSDAPARTVSEVLRRDFASREASAANVVALGVDASARSADIGAYATTLSRIPGVARVDALTGSYAGGRLVFPATPVSQRFQAPQGTYLAVIPAVEPVSAEGEKLVAALRSTPSPLGDVIVGGQSAQLVDSKRSIADKIPLAAGIIALATIVVLFLSFGSLLVPAKAVVLNLLSLTATFGAMVWIFQEGHLSGPLGFTATGSLTASMPILMFCIAFGLSMDYEVFLLSRIKEEHDRGLPNEQAVAIGLERTGRIVTAAALLIALVFASFALTAGISFMIMFGIGLTMAVVMDATLIRAALVPAFMKLAGEANWWAPKPLKRLYDRYGISEGDDVPEPAKELERA
jgi:RND superfamily putative drug exporter